MQRWAGSNASEAPGPQAHDGSDSLPAAARLQQQQQQGASAILISGSSSSGSSSSGSYSSSDSASCCSEVFAQRVASFKTHPSSAAARQQRMDLSSSLRAEGRAQLLRQLREEAARQLEQQQKELLQPPEEQQQQLGGAPIGRGGPSLAANRVGPSPGAACEALEAQRLRQLLTQPRAIVEPPQELLSGDYMAALRPEGRSCLLLLRNGKGHLYDKKERAVFRVVCSSSSAAAAAATAAATAAAPLFSGTTSLFPSSLEEGLQQQEDASPFLPPEEKQRLLLLRAGSLDVSRCLSSGAAAANSSGNEEALPGRAHAAFGVECVEATAMDQEVQQPEQQEQQQQQQQQRQQRRQQQYKPRRQQQRRPPLLQLPTGILSKGLTLLDCILCPFTPANVEYFSARRSAEGPAAAAAAAAAGGKRVAWQQEEPMWRLLFIVDVLFLGGTMLGQCEFECRHFFLRSRFNESPASFAPLQLLPFVEASFSHLQMMFRGPFVYPPDGFLFYHKEAPHVGGSNPFLLCWRDEGIARFPLDEKNVGQSRVDTFLLFHPNGEVYSDDGVLTARVDPKAFGLAALPGPSVLHCWVSNFSADSGLFLEVQLPPEDAERQRVSPHFKQMDLDAPSPLRPQLSENGEQDEGGSVVDCTLLSQGEKQGTLLGGPVGGPPGGPPEVGKWSQQTAAAATAAKTRRQQLQQTGSRSRMQNKWKHKDRVADSYTKLVDQWLRLRGVHPVSLEVLLNHCLA
ncbi:hypothetical protein Esti_004694 [Eimeria stiedai]